MAEQKKTAGNSGTTSFGNRQVPVAEKARLVQDVFDRVADRYDMMNDLMSGGLHRQWKAHMVAALALPTNNRPFSLLDVAGGTGDIAFRAVQRGGSGLAATVLDINEEMLRVGTQRAERKGLDHIRFIAGNADSLPLPDASMDAYTIAFGIRNVTHREAALQEAWRVLRPGGRFLCLEFSHVTHPLLNKIYDAWSFKAIPGIGRLVAGDAEPYQYLVESIRQFPDADTFASEITDAGFSRVRFERLTGGIAALHSGWRI